MYFDCRSYWTWISSSSRGCRLELYYQFYVCLCPIMFIFGVYRQGCGSYICDTGITEYRNSSFRCCCYVDTNLNMSEIAARCKTPGEVIVSASCWIWFKCSINLSIHLTPACEKVVMENKSSNWDQLCFNIFGVCHCVQTLTQTLCVCVSFQKQSETGGPGSINRSPGNQDRTHVRTFACVHTHTPPHSHTHAHT